MKMKMKIICIGCLVVVNVTLFRCFNPLQSKRGSKRKLNRNNGRSNWQTLPRDIMGMILQRLYLSDRIRFSLVCKDWQSVAMRTDIHSAPEFPWLVVSDHDQLFNCRNYLSFSSLSEGKVGKLKLPKPVRGGWFHGCSNHWLIMVQEKGLHSEIILLNPISGAQHKLPSLGTIPRFQEFVSDGDWDFYGAYMFCDQVALSTSDINSEHCMVAAIFNDVLVLCRPRDKAWSVFKVFYDQDGEPYLTDILFSSSGVLYAVVTNFTDDKIGVVAASRTIKFGDNLALELKLVYSEIENTEDIWRIQYYDDYKIRMSSVSYLLESITSNEVLVIQQLYDNFLKREEHNIGEDFEDNIGEDFEWFDRQSGTSYVRTRGFRVFKVDPKTGNSLIRVQSLDDELLFLADCGSFSLPTSDFKELKGNCIYFARNRFMGVSSSKPYTCRDIGVFYLDSGRIERSFPSANLSIQSKLSWFRPNLL